MDATLEIAGEVVHLLSERALYWERAATLVTADLHWGKAATFRAAGLALPRGTTTDDLERLDRALARTGARRLVLLGDLFHARAGRIAANTLAAIRAWRSRHAAVELLLVRGNHDRHAGDPSADLRINALNPPAYLPPFALRHEPAESPEAYTLAGHLHPAVSLHGRGRLHEQLPCFVIGPRVAVLPAFGSFTGCAAVDPMLGDRVYVVAGPDVIEVSPRSDQPSLSSC
jgi:DNA ligase-associated metallophosphoesterase